MKTISLVIPIYNEGERIEKSIKTLKKGFCFDGLKLEKVVFVDDGSLDCVKEKIKSQIPNLKQALKAKVEIINYRPNRGRGYAVLRGAMNCNSDYIAYADADFSIPLTNLKNFLPFMANDYDLLFGSKKKPGARQTIKRSTLRAIVGFGHSLIACMVLGVFAWDFQGGFKVFSKKFVTEVFPQLTLTRWGFDMEVVFLAKKLGYKTREIPVVWSHIENNSKVKLARDIYRALEDMVRIRLNWNKKKYRLQPSIPYLAFSS